MSKTPMSKTSWNELPQPLKMLHFRQTPISPRISQAKLEQHAREECVLQSATVRSSRATTSAATAAVNDCAPRDIRVDGAGQDGLSGKRRRCLLAQAICNSEAARISSRIHNRTYLDSYLCGDRSCAWLELKTCGDVQADNRKQAKTPNSTDKSAASAWNSQCWASRS